MVFSINYDRKPKLLVRGVLVAFRELSIGLQLYTQKKRKFCEVAFLSGKSVHHLILYQMSFVECSW